MLHVSPAILHLVLYFDLIGLRVACTYSTIVGKLYQLWQGIVQNSFLFVISCSKNSPQFLIINTFTMVRLFRRIVQNCRNRELHTRKNCVQIPTPTGKVFRRWYCTQNCLYNTNATNNWLIVI